LRMRAILTTIAGRVYLATRAAPAERAAYDALLACEDLTLPLPAAATQVAAVDPFPPFKEDVQRAQEALPAWMGIQFRDASPELRNKLNLSAGAAAVMTVFPDAPAATAGLQTGDIITGPPGKPFNEPKEVRAWTMLSEVGKPRRLEVLREGEPLQVTLIPAPYPLKWPELPGPPEVGSEAPPLKVSAYRGSMPVDGKPHLLFFWATWCAPCKASLPEVLAFERQSGTSVLAITDEMPEQLDKFFQIVQDFPQNVAVDEYRRAFLAYGVSGTPTYVLVDAAGHVQSYSSGYSAEKGLGIDGWTWPEKSEGKRRKSKVKESKVEG
jgi:thiol-disulfide isomerase/thioredoxin